jgi:hypothetical protein
MISNVENLGLPDPRPLFAIAAMVLLNFCQYLGPLHLCLRKLQPIMCDTHNSLRIFDIVLCFLIFYAPLPSTILMRWVSARNRQTDFLKRSPFVASRLLITWIEPVNFMSLAHYDSATLVSSSAVKGDATVLDGCQRRDINVSESQDVLQLLYRWGIMRV